MVGDHQHCVEAHLHRYLAEFDFRYNRKALGIEDAERAEDLLRMARVSEAGSSNTRRNISSAN